MDDREAKLALARKKLKDHQQRKLQETNKKDSHLDNNDDVYIIEPNQSNNDDNSAVVSTVQNIDINNSCTGQVLVEEHKNTENAINATEILISNKRNLELQNIDLQTKLSELENLHSTTVQHYNNASQKINNLEEELKNLKYYYQTATDQLISKEELIKEINNSKSLLTEEKSNLLEQLEFTKTLLTTKETENDSLQNQLNNIQNKFDTTQLQLQQLTSGIHSIQPNEKQLSDMKHENEVLHQKVASLEQQLKIQLRDYQQINSHYENYVGELNNQLKTTTKKNEELTKELQNLSNRECSLIEQIGEMEIRLQNFSTIVNMPQENNTQGIVEIEAKYKDAMEQLQEISTKYDKLQHLYSESQATIELLQKSKEFVNQQQEDVVSMSKLNADITSDKIAAQRATEQNIKLKHDIQGLEDAFIKMSNDKLELTEKLTAEKYLNRELTIKLADIDEKAKSMQIKLKAKDEEMIRLQATYRELEMKYNELDQCFKNVENSAVGNSGTDLCETGDNNEAASVERVECNNKIETEPLIECSHEKHDLPKDHAMHKLQERFFKIMGEVADLSDEKHRLEHIITQLQNETDTICEYVALYQQQRSLLKKRDEERSAQIKIFQSECSRLQSQLDELTGILKRFSEDKELYSYFQIQSKHEDIQKVMSLLSSLKTNSIIDPHKTIEFNSFYPCNCCSGKLIEV